MDHGGHRRTADVPSDVLSSQLTFSCAGIQVAFGTQRSWVQIPPPRPPEPWSEPISGQGFAIGAEDDPT